MGYKGRQSRRPGKKNAPTLEPGQGALKRKAPRKRSAWTKHQKAFTDLRRQRA